MPDKEQTKKPVKLLGGTLDLDKMEVILEDMEDKEYQKANENPPIEVIGGTISISSDKMGPGDSWLIEYLGTKLVVEMHEGGIIDIIEMKGIPPVNQRDKKGGK